MPVAGELDLGSISIVGAEGATAPETLRQIYHRSMRLWREAGS